MIRKPLKKVANASNKRRQRRKLAIRKTVSGNAETPRLSIVKSNKHLSVQVINDESRVTLFSVQTYGKNAVEAKNNIEGGKTVGTKLGEGLKSKGISSAVFDRNGYKYHGVVAAVVEAVREAGIRV